MWTEDPLSSSRLPRNARSVSTPLPSARRLHPTISLDRIAGLHEKPAATSIKTCPPRQPLTPHKTNQRTPRDKNALWEHMPSSPIVPPSSPSADSARLSALPLRAKTRKSLEWACAKARAGGHEKLGGIGEDRCEEMETDDETDSEMEEAVTPNSSISFVDLSYKHDKHSAFVPYGKENIDPNLFPAHLQSDDIEAAMILLGFMGTR